MHDRLVWWPRIPIGTRRMLFPASDPQVPPGLPVTVDVVARQSGRDAAPANPVPVRAGTIVAFAGWARHDPACTAPTHAYVRALVNEFNLGRWVALSTTVYPDAGAWQRLSGRQIIGPGTTTARISVSIEQANTATCIWWIADDVGRFIG